MRISIIAKSAAAISATFGGLLTVAGRVGEGFVFLVGAIILVWLD